MQWASDYLQINLLWMQIPKPSQSGTKAGTLVSHVLWSRGLPVDVHTRFGRPANFIDLHLKHIFSFILSSWIYGSGLICSSFFPWVIFSVFWLNRSWLAFCQVNVHAYKQTSKPQNMHQKTYFILNNFIYNKVLQFYIQNSLILLIQLALQKKTEYFYLERA